MVVAALELLEPAKVLVVLLVWGAVQAFPPAHADTAITPAVCAELAETNLEELAAAESTMSARGCDVAGSADFVYCGARGTVGSCAAISACINAPIDTAASDDCSIDRIDHACCIEFLTKVVNVATESTGACWQLCDTSSSPPSSSGPPSANTDSVCAEISQDSLEVLVREDPKIATTSCSSADSGIVCDTRGSAGTCSSVAACDEFDTTIGDYCTSAADDSGCCGILLAKPCSTCDPEPVLCFQSCVPGGVSGGSPAAGGTSISSGLSDELTIVGGSGSSGGGGGGVASTSPESTGAAVPLLGQAVWVVSGAAAAALSALL